MVRHIPHTYIANSAIKEDEREAIRKAKEAAEKAERDEKKAADAKKAAETNDQLEILRAAVSASVRERGGGVGMRVVPSSCAKCAFRSSSLPTLSS